MDRRPATPRLWTIPPSAPFLERLADALLAGTLVPGSHVLEEHLIFLPTRRACRELTDILIERAGGEAVALPRIRPLGDIDEAELAFDGGIALGGGSALDVKPAIEPLPRLLTLTRLVLAWGRSVAQTLMVPGRDEPVAIPVRAGDAAALARDLARLIDDFETEARDFSGLATLVAEDHAQYWAITLAFLRIVTEQWPAYLEAQGLGDPATRRDSLLRLEAARLARTPPPGAVIAAGSTGSIPATAELLGAIARLPHGAVVLPGLDLGMDEESWAALDDAQGPHPGHPQYGLKRLLGRIGAVRGIVETLGKSALPDREFLVSEAFRPVATTERWADIGNRIDQGARDRAVGGLRLVETSGEQEEATAIALMMREAVETPGRTAALVTPDRGLARRTSAELGRWGLTVDDSAGVPLADTPAGTLFRLIAEAAAAKLAPVSLVALLQHPLATFGLDPAAARPAARALELIALRGLRPRPGTEGLKRIVAHRLTPGPADRVHHTVRHAIAAQGVVVADLCARVAAALRPLEALGEQDEVPLGELVAAHEAALTAIGGDGGREGEAGRGLSDFLDALDAGDGGLELSLEEYPALLSGLMAGRVVRPARPGHPRLQILGPIEARLLTADLVILGGLNEGTWPADTRADPFLNRPMRADAGLEAPERFIGLAAHDVAGLMSQPEAALVRAAKLGGEPTVASRWLQRLEAVAGKTAYGRIKAAGAVYAYWARDIDLADVRDDIGEPKPRPSPEVRPRALSVTEIETLIRDPYAVYAGHVLGLRPLDRLDEAPDAATRGTMIHEALSRFDRALAAGGVTDPIGTLIGIGEEVFAALGDHPELRAVWWPRFVRIARWFAPIDLEMRAGLAARHVELSGGLALDIAGTEFQLRGRADRIDVYPDGRIGIVDYKTGNVPSAKQVESGLSPQLPLEAAMALAGGFAGLPPPGGIAGYTYVELKGVRTPGRIVDIRPEGRDPETLAAETLSRLRGMMTRFARADVPYRAKTHVQQRRWGTDYDHLSRFAEWSAAEGGED